VAEPAFTFLRHACSWRVAVVLACIYAGVAALLIRFNAVWWIAAGLVAVTLPALVDLATGARAGMRLDHDTLGWFTGRRHGTLALAEIEKMRFDTRWDFSVRVTAELPDGKRVRLPQEAMPPHRAFEAELQARGVAVERHHFTVF
jgi:hypothetical protein